MTFGFTVWGAKLAALAGFDFSHAEFWQWPGPKRALAESILSDTSSLTDLGMILGAMAAAAATKPFARTAWPPAKSLLAAAIGGLLMGWGARIGFGCNIGAFVGGVASGSLHGWIWFAAALGGCAIGIRLRPAVRPLARLRAVMRFVYALVLILGLGAVVADHLSSPSSARAVSPEDFAGACAPCGAPCPSAQKK